MTISHIKLPLRHAPPPIFYKSLYVVLKENRRGICSARVVPMAKICAIGSPPTDCIILFCYQHAAHYQTSATQRPSRRLYTTVLLPTGHFQTIYYCSATHRPTTRVYTAVLLRNCQLPDCILLFCYPQAHCQTVCYCSTNHRHTTRLYTTAMLPTFRLPETKNLLI